MTSNWSDACTSCIHVVATSLMHKLRYDVYDTYDIMLK